MIGIEEQLNAAPEGQRGGAIFRLACKLRRAGVPIEMAGTLVGDAIEGWDPPFPLQDARERIARAYAGHPDGWHERYILDQEEKLRPDPALHIYTGGHTAHRRDIVEANAAELALSHLTGTGAGAPPPSLPLLGQPGYIIEGWSHLLAGYPRCGKSELLARLCREWLARGKRVVYFTEEPRSIWEHRLGNLPGPGAHAGPEGWAGLRVCFALGTALDVLYQRAFGGDEEVVVIDTMRNLLQLEDETDNSRIALVLNPWIAGARASGKTLVMAHHMRKGVSENGEGIAGGHALLGTFDVALEILRDEGVPRRRRIRCYARLISPREMVYEMDEEGNMRYLGHPDALKLDEVESRILVVLGDQWRKTREVRAALGEPLPGIDQVRHALTGLALRGEIERCPPIDEHAQGHTIQWRRKHE
jgi:hypothetical protein